MAQAINHHPNHHHDEHKRVSFGTEEQVTKIVYDAAPDGYDYNNVHIVKTTTNMYTCPDAPPSKVRVTSEEKDIPRPISPPAQLEDLRPATSPPLPALVKKMEHHDHDNPFRPQENLYHEVDPIVEAYKNRPFPPSPVGSPIPEEHHQHNTTTTVTKTTKTNDNGATTTVHETVQTYTFSTPQKAPQTHPGNVRADMIEAKRNSEQHENAQLLNDLPPPNKVEVVHLEKKKKCGCCTVQ